MERSVCRTSLAAGILAQLSIIGRWRAPLERLWRGTHAAMLRAGPQAQDQWRRTMYPGRTVFWVAADLPTSLPPP